MKKTYLEIGSSVGAVLVFIVLIVIVNAVIPTYGAFGNVLILLLFVIAVGFMGMKLAEIKD